MKGKEKTILNIRRFNRFYTVLLGFLNKNYLDSGFSVTETRILFELHEQRGINANYLIELLRLDKSYMSRTIRALEKKGILERKEYPGDGRSLALFLTEEGYAITEKLIETTNRDIERLINHLDDQSCERISNAMDLIIDELSKGKEFNEDELI